MGEPCGPMFEKPLGAEQMPKANSLLRGEVGQLFDSLLEDQFVRLHFRKQFRPRVQIFGGGKF